MKRAALLPLALLLAGCGGHAQPSGRQVFQRACAGCHASDASPGGSLRSYRLTREQIASFARIMPVRPKLSDAEIAAVARYVFEQQQRR